MKLSIDNLGQVKASCEALGSLQGLLDAETFAEITEKGLEIKQMADSLSSVLADLNTAGATLEKNGFSDEWFAIVNEGGKFTKLLDIDMPTFFKDNNAKKEACQEAIADGIKRFLTALWNAVVAAFKWLWDLFAKVIHAIHDVVAKDMERNENMTERACSEMLSRVKNFSLVYNGPDPKLMCEYIQWYTFLVGAIWDSMWDDDLVSDIEPGEDIKPYFYEKLQHICVVKKIPPTDIKKCGFKIEENGVTFINPEEIPEVEITYTTVNELRDRIRLMKASRQGALGSANQLKLAANSSRKTHDDLKREANVDLMQGAVSTKVCEYKQAIEQCRLSGFLASRLRMLAAIVVSKVEQPLNVELSKIANTKPTP